MRNIFIVTGFLGSGKSTLLNRLLRDPDMATTAVLVNELGDVGIDHLIVDQFDEDIVLLESGCVCCSVRDDLTAALLNLHSRADRGEIPAFEQAVLETTGIADPASILQLLMSDRLVCERFQLGGTITLVDACYWSDNLVSIPETLQQVLMADRLVISKTDLVDDQQLRTLRNKLESINPTAFCISASEATPTRLFQAAPAHLSRAMPDKIQHQGRFATIHLGWQQPVPWRTIEVWMEGLLPARGDDIFRIKGILNIEGEPRPVIFQAVQHSVYAPDYLQAWPGGDPRTDLTFIVQYLSKDAVLASLRPFVDV